MFFLVRIVERTFIDSIDIDYLALRVLPHTEMYRRGFERKYQQMSNFGFDSSKSILTMNAF